MDGVRVGAAVVAHGSPEFEQLWQRHDASPPPSGWVDMTHPVVGPLRLRYDRLAIIESPGLLLVLQQAEPGSESEKALTQLARTAAIETTH